MHASRDLNRVAERLAADRERGRASLVPYFTSTYPDSATTEALIRRADEQGAAVVELGLPFSDSIADGPVIQASFHECLSRGYRTEDTFRLCEAVRPHVGCGLVAMVSYSVASAGGIEAFMARAAATGFDGIILPDVPVEEAEAGAQAAASAGLCHIGLIAPRTSPRRCAAIAARSTGFIYRVAVAGTTGERGALPSGLREEVGALRQSSGLPVCVGFGVSTAAQVRELGGFCDGVIVGSAIVRRISDGVRAGEQGSSIVDAVGGFVGELCKALAPTT